MNLYRNWEEVETQILKNSKGRSTVAIKEQFSTFSISNVLINLFNYIFFPHYDIF